MPDFDRRDFLKLVGVSAGATAVAGCSDHVEKLIPYVVQPEEITPGVPVHYASTCRECPVGCGIHVKTREGRPIKLEGNPEHPINRGRLCARAQASVGRTYLPDRFPGPMQRGPDGELAPISWDEALGRVAKAVAEAPGRAHLLGGPVGDTLGGLLDRFVEAAGLGGRTVYEPFGGGETLREATRQVFGVASEPVFDVSEADLILDFGAEMLESGPSVVEHQRQWAEARDVSAHEHGGARLVYVGPRLSLTASSADEWLPARPGTEGILALALARAAVEAGAGGGAHRGLLAGVLAGASVEKAAEACDVPAARIRRVAAGLARARRAVALPPGPGLSSRRAVATASAVLVLNHVTGAVGTAMKVPPAQPGRRPSYRDVLALTQAMQDGKVGVLLIHDANPVYSLPRTAGFREALDKVGLVVSFASARDETAMRADLVLPDHAPLESWGDLRPRAGVRALAQPTFRPLHDTRALGDAVLDLGRAMGEGVAARLPSGSFRQVLEQAWSDVDFRQALRRGGVYGETPHLPVSLQADGLEVVAPKMTGEGAFTLVAFPHAFLGDGSGAPLPWLQEIPDPVTSVAWESWAEISLGTAERLGVEPGDVIAIETSAGRIEAAAYPRGGIRDDVVAVPTGQGHTVGYFASKEDQGLAGTPRGVNVAEALPAAVDEKGGRAWLTERARLASTGRHRRLPLLQTHDNKRGRQLGEAITLTTLLEAATGKDGHGGGGHGEAAAAAAGVQAHHGAVGPEEASHGEGHGEHAVHEIRRPYDPADDARDEKFLERFPDAVGPSPYRWGMTIDLDRCTGCSACIAACYVENNVPVVGEEETRRNRQMTWLRIDRWVGEGEPDLHAGRGAMPRNSEKLGETDVRNSPMLCQHCGAAPCEPVCPVIATYHNPEGLNAMIYNRCIGTRYCANNCPYKVRRFNYWDHQLTKWPSPMELGLNPDVTVRGQGVMEKCTFCVQRIQAARQDAKNAGHPIRDGAVRTACQQTCPSEAITFGNLRDEDSEVVRKASDEKRGYHALHVLNTRPAITYLAKVIRGPVEGS